MPTIKKEGKVPQPVTAPKVDMTEAAHAYADLLIQQAKQLEVERADLLERIGANREDLRRIDTQGNLSEEQGKFLDVWYPGKRNEEHRTKDEVEATRKLKEQARKELAAVA